MSGIVATMVIGTVVEVIGLRSVETSMFDSVVVGRFVTKVVGLSVVGIAISVTPIGAGGVGRLCELSSTNEINAIKKKTDFNLS